MSEPVIDLDTQIAIVEREIKMRASVYPRRVAEKKMSQANADLQTAGMRAVLQTLTELRRVRDAATG